MCLQYERRTLCKYNMMQLRKGDLCCSELVARVRRVRRGSICLSSILLSSVTVVEGV